MDGTSSIIFADFYNTGSVAGHLFLAGSGDYNGRVYPSCQAVVFLFRFLEGKWKTMRVIEAVPVVMPRQLPTVPATEVEHL